MHRYLIDVKLTSRNSQMKRRELEDTEAEVEIESKTLGSLEGDAAALQHSINATLYEKQRALEKLASIQVRSFFVCCF